MLYSEIIAVCSEIHIRHIKTLCGQNVVFFNVKHGGTYSNHWALWLNISFRVVTYYFEVHTQNLLVFRVPNEQI
jgi:hypothetical protein